MAKLNRADLKSKFEHNDIPSQTDFENLIDSCINEIDDEVSKETVVTVDKQQTLTHKELIDPIINSVPIAGVVPTVDAAPDNNLVLSQGIKPIKTKADAADTKADAAVSTANESNTKADSAVNTANEANTKADSVVSIANEANTKADNAVSVANEANTKVDDALDIADEANTKADNAVSTANSASDKADNAYSLAETNLTVAKNYTDVEVSAALTSANGYTDTKASETLTSANNYTDTKSSETLTSANGYTDTEVSEVLTSANSYTDTKASETLTSANSYTDTEILAEDTSLKSYVDDAVEDAIENQLINITYADLTSAITAKTLIPGARYLITDFRTIHYFSDGNTTLLDAINTATTEPLIVTATKIDDLNKLAISTVYPQDIIYYDWNPDNWKNDCSFSDCLSAEPGEETIITGFKGVIYYRKDTINNNTASFDFRGVKFRRWSILNAPAWSDAVTYAKNDFVNYNNILYISSVDSNLNNIPTANSYAWIGLVDYVNEDSKYLAWYTDVANTDGVFIYNHVKTDTYADFNVFDPLISKDNYIYVNKTTSNSTILFNLVFLCGGIFNNTIKTNTISNKISSGTFVTEIFNNYIETVEFDCNIIRCLDNSNIKVYELSGNMIYGMHITQANDNIFSNNFIYSCAQNVFSSLSKEISNNYVHSFFQCTINNEFTGNILYILRNTTVNCALLNIGVFPDIAVLGDSVSCIIETSYASGQDRLPFITYIDSAIPSLVIVSFSQT
ncbi:MAG TPA: alanine-zipper protein [bacterium]|nr:alanine-zipper protein [bacterium]